MTVVAQLLGLLFQVYLLRKDSGLPICTLCANVGVNWPMHQRTVNRFHGPFDPGMLRGVLNRMPPFIGDWCVFGDWV